MRKRKRGNHNLGTIYLGSRLYGYVLIPNSNRWQDNPKLALSAYARYIVGVKRYGGTCLSFRKWSRNPSLRRMVRSYGLSIEKVGKAKTGKAQRWRLTSGRIIT